MKFQINYPNGDAAFEADLLRAEMQTMRIETVHQLIGQARRSAFGQSRKLVHDILMEYAVEHFDPIIPLGDVPAAYMDALDTALQTIDDWIHQEFGNTVLETTP